MTAAGLGNAEFFASPDLLHTKDLSSAKAIDGQFADTLEVKLTGSVIVTQWHTI